jgi:hypothetical protein
VGFFADKEYRARDVVIGQYAGISALYIISVVAALISLVIPPAYIGLLGLAPVAIGIKKLYCLTRNQRMEEPVAGPGHRQTVHSITHRTRSVRTIARVPARNRHEQRANSFKSYTATPTHPPHTGLAWVTAVATRKTTAAFPFLQPLTNGPDAITASGKLFGTQF